MEHCFQPLTSARASDVPDKRLRQWLPAPVTTPAELEPDVLDVWMRMSDSELDLSGLIVRLIFDLKDGYFGLYDKISDVNEAKGEHVAVKMSPMPEQSFAPHPEAYRPMNVKLRMEVENIRAHCLFHSTRSGDANAEDDEASEKEAGGKAQLGHSLGHRSASLLVPCPIVFNEQIAVELSKVHKEALVQVHLAPTIATFAPMSVSPSRGASASAEAASGWLALNQLEFRGHGLYSDVDVPWSVEIVEYGWLIEITLGRITGSIQNEHVSICGGGGLRVPQLTLVFRWPRLCILPSRLLCSRSSPTKYGALDERNSSRLNLVFSFDKPKTPPIE